MNSKTLREIALGIQGVSTGYALAKLIESPRDVRLWGQLTICIGATVKTFAS